MTSNTNGKVRSDELLGRIQKRTGETREAVEKAIKEFSLISWGVGAFYAFSNRENAVKALAAFLESWIYNK